MTACEVCQVEIEASRHGRPRRYCTERCRSRARRMKGGRLLHFGQSVSELTKKPAFVKGRSAQIWKQYAPELERMGVLKSTDVDMFGGWCCLMAEFAESPHTFPTARLAQLRGLAKSFGLTPGGRRGIRTEPPRKPDPGEEYFT